MQINVNIVLAPDDSDPVKTPDELAQAFLEAVDGVPEKDTVACFIHRPSAQMGSAGGIPVSEPPPLPVQFSEEGVPIPVPPPPTQ